MYLLQLVQALKFEEDRVDSPLSLFLIERGIENHVLGTLLYWYLMVECEDKCFSRKYAKIAYQYLSELLKVIA
jgi:phosphatidylinositol 3-kinase